MKTQVAIVEDRAGICEELRQLIDETQDLACCCVCRNPDSALQRLPAARPDVILMDIEMPNGSGIRCTAQMKRLLPTAQILMFTVHDDPDTIIEALEAGASGYLLKSAPGQEIVAAIRDVQNQGAPMSREVARKLIHSFHRPIAQPVEGDEPLSPREQEILELLGDGLLYKEISDRLSIKLDTVGTHIKNIYRKLHVRSRTEAVMKYFR